ncbi:MAG: adenylate/guanylate cyclase domain-containing protein [Leptospiraceae bacterium]|nr:adenylate/guanylate cyclase domain-containing protein [Leptospiraceae bacterium]
MEKNSFLPKTQLLPNAMILMRSYSFHSPVEECWDLISHTENINRAVGLSEVQYREEPSLNGGSVLFGRVGGPLESEYREHPFEWVEYQYLSVLREYSKGPLKKVLFAIEVRKKPGGFDLDLILQIVPASLFVKPAIWYEMQFNTLPNFKKVYERIAESKREGEIFHWEEKKLRSLNKNSDLFKRLIIGFSEFEKNKSIIEGVADFVFHAPDRELLKIKPIKLSRELGIDSKELLVFFLKGTRKGFFNLNWDILCPYCRGVKSSSHSLSGLKDRVHCPSCNIDYGPDFDKSVEVSFVIHPNIKELSEGMYCFGSPMNSPHIRAQQRIPPGEERSIEMNLKDGFYKIYSLNLPEVSLQIEVDESFPRRKEIYFPTEGNLQICRGKHHIYLKNPKEYEILVRIERADWLKDVVTANMLTTMQEFRDLFSSEVLRPGQEISIQNLCILFTDLKGSTEFYNSKGDAFAFRLVGQHFDILIKNASLHGGAIVKTIGDAVMAVFLNPLSALNYSFQVLRDIKELNNNLDEKLIEIKIGMHTGPVLAVNLNDRLDYFGTTVNRAARIEGQCNGSDIVISKETYEFPGVNSILEGKEVEKINSSLKGFSGTEILYRILP